jgi:general secretion pathway protein K
MRKRDVEKNEGFALILTVLIISLIVASTLNFNTSMRCDLDSAVNLREAIRAGTIARSGFDYALAVLIKDSLASDFDSLHEPWADSETLSEVSASMFERGRFNVQIVDHSGKIQINQLIEESGAYNTKQKDLLARFLGSEQFGLSAEEVDNIIDAIKDWIDPDDEVTRFGAENTFYQSQETPYSCRNAPMEFPEELLFVKGVTKELFFGTDERPGISSYIATHGDGRVNINTAGPLVLKALSDQLDLEMAAAMVAYRDDEENDLKDPKWYVNTPGMSEVGIDPDLVTTSSVYFEIMSKAFVTAAVKTVKAMVKREKGESVILSWKID